MIFLTEKKHFFIIKKSLSSSFTISIILLLTSLINNINAQETLDGSSEAQKKLLHDLKRQDKCETIFLAKAYGYDIKEYKVQTNDGFILSLHRLIHPEDIHFGGPKQGTKKPYLLLHGLIGSSSSFLRNIDWRYKAPKKTFDADLAVEWAIKSTNYDTTVRCSAQKFKEAFEGDKTATAENLSIADRLLNIWPEKDFCYINELDYDGDRIIFGREFKQAYRKYELNKDNKRLVSTSLAFTLSNFGYDVWFLNLRGNYYSNRHARDDPLTQKQIFINEYKKNRKNNYWNFNINTLIENDLPKMIDFVRKETRVTQPMGLVSYSYSALHVLGLLTKYPQYQESLQPIVMVAPALLTASDDRSHLAMKYFMQIASKTLINKIGPFPEFTGHSSNDYIKKLICKIPIASRLCRLLETILHGQTENVSEVKRILLDNKKTSLMKEDSDCGQTSTAVLQQIINNLNSQKIDTNYVPWTQSRQLVLRGKAKPQRRSIMLVHSETDDISTMSEVKKIRESALKTMTLLDYVIKQDNFAHTDFLFSKRNQYLVNAEIARMTTLYDYMMYLKPANVEARISPLKTQPIL